MHEFVAIVTNPRVYVMPTPLARALEQVDAWIESPTVMLLAEGPMHWQALRPLLSGSRVAGGLVHDAKIAAICLQYGVRALWSADRDFSRFAGLAVSNPLLD